MTNQVLDYTAVNLKTDVHGCLRELEACSNGLAYLDHQWGKILDALDQAEIAFEPYESAAVEQARSAAEKGATATEIKAATNALIAADVSAAASRETLRKVQRQKAKCERWIRSLEKRLTAAQSAANGHALLAKAGG